MIFTKSENFKQEYCCSIIKIDKVEPIPNSDFLGIVNVNGLPIVVRKDQVKEGDIVFYASNETKLVHKFLFTNNFYEDSSLNKDTTRRGYFNKYGRVRTVKLRGVQSFGFIFTLKELKNAYNINISDLTPYINTDFDSINDELFISVYLPPIKECNSSNNHKTKKATKKANRIDRIIPGEFNFHYDTQPLGKNLSRFNSYNIITISVKLHGTSAIFGNVKSNIPNKLPWYKKFINLFGNIYPKSHIGYSEIYSSRTVIKNRWATSENTQSYYDVDLWGEYAKLLAGKIPEGMTIYGEIIGYQTGKSTFIQKGYDYGCKPGTNKLMIYRINVEDKKGITYEWNVSDVYNWTLNFIDRYPELKPYIHPIDILYHGPIREFIPLDPAQHWQENFLKALSEDKGLGMEQLEPLCNNKVPREGIVIRIDDDPIKEAFKLKCIKFLTRESKEIDKGNVDIEMENNNY